MKRALFTVVTLALLVGPVATAQETDKEGCKDSPLVTRFPGSVLYNCKDQQDDTAEFPLAKGPKKIEGEVHVADYHYPKSATKPQLVRNFKTALQTAGFTLDYDSGNGDLVFHKGGTWIYESISVGGWYEQTIAGTTALKQDVTADASALANSINSTGHASVYGILFDTGKADIKPESAASLEQVGKLLKQDPRLKLYVVGHTDNVGALPANMDLSQRRAAAVVKALTGQYGVPAARLQPFGDGPYAPVASNDTEDGRALNRRVELVKQ